MDFLDEQKQAGPRAPSKERRREERPKNNPKEDLGYRIKGLEAAKMEPGMSPADLAALDRSIEALKKKQAEKNQPKQED